MVDADLVLEMLVKRVEYLVNADQVWDIIRSQTIKAYITNIGLDKLHNYISQWQNLEIAKEVNVEIENIIQVCCINPSIFEKARSSNIVDFESAIEVACAIKHRLDGIVTQHPQNFTGTTLAIYSVDNLLRLRRVKLSQWFFHPFEVFNSFGLDWQSPKESIYRSPIDKISDQPENSVTRFKIINLTKQAEQNIRLIVQVRQKHDDEVLVFMLVRSAGESIYLPSGLQLAVLNESGETLEMIEAGSVDNSIQINLSACLEDDFSIKFSLNDACVIEHFAI
jgi:hypothetical protein